MRPPVSLTPGAGYPWGRELSLRARGLVSAARPRLPGRYRSRRPAPWCADVQEGREMEEVTGEPLYRDRVCGIDIGKAELYATIRVPSDSNPARRASETRRFAATRRGVLALADWLRCWQVPAVVMEATGDYWKGPFYRLEAEGFGCVLADARQVKNRPGRPKRDPSDSAWLAACFERGAVTPCFVAAPGVPADPAPHPLPTGPDRRTQPGE